MRPECRREEGGSQGRLSARKEGPHHSPSTGEEISTCHNLEHPVTRLQASTRIVPGIFLSFLVTDVWFMNVLGCCTKVFHDLLL